MTLRSSKIGGENDRIGFFLKKVRDNLCTAQPALLCCNGSIFLFFFALLPFELETTVLEEHGVEYQQRLNC